MSSLAYISALGLYQAQREVTFCYRNVCAICMPARGGMPVNTAFTLKENVLNLDYFLM